MDWVSVEALDSEMAVLGVSPDSRTPAPVYWAPGEALPKPDDPKSFLASTAMSPPGNGFLQIWFFLALLLPSILVFGSIPYRRILKQIIFLSY